MTVKLAFARNAMAAALALAFLSACATGPQVRTQSARGLDLSRYSTYGYVKHPGTNRGSYRSFTTQELERAVDKQMQARGFQKGPHPQLLIDFHTNVRNKVTGYWGEPSYGWGWGWGWGPWGPRWGPGWWGPGPWGFGYGSWGSVQTYAEGTLTISVIDASTHDAIWSGSAVALITRGTLAHPRQSIDLSVASIFAKFPKAPAGGAPSH